MKNISVSINYNHQTLTNEVYVTNCAGVSIKQRGAPVVFINAGADNTVDLGLARIDETELVIRPVSNTTQAT